MYPIQGDPLSDSSIFQSMWDCPRAPMGNWCQYWFRQWSYSILAVQLRLISKFQMLQPLYCLRWHSKDAYRLTPLVYCSFRRCRYLQRHSPSSTPIIVDCKDDLPGRLASIISKQNLLVTPLSWTLVQPLTPGTAHNVIWQEAGDADTRSAEGPKTDACSQILHSRGMWRLYGIWYYNDDESVSYRFIHVKYQTFHASWVVLRRLQTGSGWNFIEASIALLPQCLLPDSPSK